MPVYRVPVQGLSRLANSIGGGQTAYDAGFQGEAQGQSNMARAIAESRLKNAQADEVEQQQGMRTPEAIRSNAMAGYGIPESAGSDVDEFLKTGKIARFTPLPAGQQGPVEPAPEWTGRLGNVGRAIMATKNALAVGDKNSSNIAEAIGRMRDQGLSDDIIAGRLAPTRVAQGQYASGVSKNEPFKANEWGSTNIITGAVDDANPVAQRYSKMRNSQTAENYAKAGNANASADEHRAGAELKRSKVGGVETTTLPDGTVVQSGGKPPKLTEDQGKATGWLVQATNAFTNMQNALDPAQGGSARASKAGLDNVVSGVPVVGEALANSYLRSGNRQRFLQGASSLSEALLRAATGAGVNKEEALQKVRELTPQIGDEPDTVKQKMDAIPLYIESLKVRAGPGAPMAERVNADAGKNKPVRVSY